MARVVIITAEDSNGQTPLQPDILNSQGQKLWNISGLTPTQYVRFIERHNLYKEGEEHQFQLARFRAAGIIGSTHSQYVKTYVVCLGRETATACGLYSVSPLYFKNIRKNTSAAYLPRFNGDTNWYKDEANYRQTADFMRQLGRVAIGEIEELPLEDLLAAVGRIAV